MPSADLDQQPSHSTSQKNCHGRFGTRFDTLIVALFPRWWQSFLARFFHFIQVFVRHNRQNLSNRNIATQTIRCDPNMAAGSCFFLLEVGSRQPTSYKINRNYWGVRFLWIFALIKKIKINIIFTTQEKKKEKNWPYLRWELPPSLLSFCWRRYCSC